MKTYQTPNNMKFGSVCSGIEAASAAWLPLGWECLFHSEIEHFPCAALKHHYPETPNLGDMTSPDFIERASKYPIDILVGGTPCQSFSVAGLRNGLNDHRGNLTLTYAELVRSIPTLRFACWENVPGVLGDKTNGFGCLLAGLVGADAPLIPSRGQKWTNAGVVTGPLGTAAWSIRDAQFFGVAQRRRRVFVLFERGIGAWRSPAALFPFEKSMCGNPAPSREKGQEITPTIRAGAPNGGPGKGARSGDRKDELIVPHCMATGQAGAEIGIGIGTTLNCNHEAPIIVIHGTQDPCTDENLAYALGRNSGQENAIAIQNATRGKSQNGLGIADPGQPMFTLDRASQHAIAFERRMVRTTGGQPSVELNGCLRADENSGDGAPCVAINMMVRRLTVKECLSLQGFPRDYFDGMTWNRKSPPADGPCYKAIGNSMAVPVMAWIGKQIEAVSKL